MFHRVLSKQKEKGYDSLPAIVFYHVGKFNDKFSFFVFLTALESMFLEEKNQEISWGSKVF